MNEELFFWLIDVTLTRTSASDQSGPESNGNEEVLHIHQSYDTIVGGNS